MNLTDPQFVTEFLSEVRQAAAASERERLGATLHDGVLPKRERRRVAVGPP